MKVILDGKRYDTDTAVEITTASFSYDGDFKAWSETLYRTHHGRWFTYGYGGPLTSYAKDVGSNTTSGGTEIRPMNEIEAMRWLEENGKTRDIEKYFPNMIQDA
jgi:hypothetical protein